MRSFYSRLVERVFDAVTDGLVFDSIGLSGRWLCDIPLDSFGERLEGFTLGNQNPVTS